MNSETSTASEDQPVMPSNPAEHKITVRSCKIKRKHLVPVGDSETMDMAEAISKLAPSRSQRGIANVVRARTGQYIGLLRDGVNFLLINPTENGDIRWLLHQRPNLPSQVSKICLVESVEINRGTIDLPTISEVGA